MGEGKTTRLRANIIKFLGDGPKSSTEILEHINKTTAYGTTAAVLNNVLGKDPRFVRIGTAEPGGTSGHRVVIYTLHDTTQQ